MNQQERVKTAVIATNTSQRNCKTNRMTDNKSVSNQKVIETLSRIDAKYKRVFEELAK